MMAAVTSLFRCPEHGRVEPRWVDGLPFCPVCEVCECGAPMMKVWTELSCTRRGCDNYRVSDIRDAFDDRPPYHPVAR